MPAPRDDSCARCGHPRDVHRHLRAGSDCSLCPCRRYAGRRGLRRLLGRG